MQAIGVDTKANHILGLAWNQLGWGLFCNVRWDDAARAFRKAIEVLALWHGSAKGFRPEFPLGGLALCLSAQGNHEEAAEIFLETIKYREKVYGPNDTDSLK